MSNARKFSKIVTGTSINIVDLDSDLSNKITIVKNRLDSDDSAIQSVKTLVSNLPPGGLSDSDLKVVADLRNQLDSETISLRNLTLDYTNYVYNSTAGQTYFTGSDANSATLSYRTDELQVFLNGIKLEAEDFTATDGTSVTLTQPAALNNQLIILVPAVTSSYVIPFNYGSISQQAVLNASNAGNQDFFGVCAIKGDMILIGASGEDTSLHDNSGAVYFFTRSGTSWTETQIIRPAAPNHYNFLGRYVSADDAFDTIAVGGDGIYFFDRSGTTWSQTAKLTGANSIGSVAISPDGTYGIAGASMAPAGGTERGEAYIYHIPSGGSWGLQATITGSDSNNASLFGGNVDISNDTAVVGAGQQTTNDTFDGAVYVYSRSGTSWSQTAKLVGTSGVAKLGESAVQIDGDTVVASSAGETVDSVYSAGAVYVFKRSGSSWSQEAKLTASDKVAHAQFGSSLSLVGDTLLIGAPQDHLPGTTTDVGSIYIFTRTGTTWTQQIKLQSSDAPNGGTQRFANRSLLAHSGSEENIDIVAANLFHSNEKGRAYVFTSS